MSRTPKQPNDSNSMQPIAQSQADREAGGHFSQLRIRKRRNQKGHAAVCQEALGVSKRHWAHARGSTENVACAELWVR